MHGKPEVLGAKPFAMPLRPQLAPQYCSHHGHFTVMRWLLYSDTRTWIKRSIKITKTMPYGVVATGKLTFPCVMIVWDDKAGLRTEWRRNISLPESLTYVHSRLSIKLGWHALNAMIFLWRATAMRINECNLRAWKYIKHNNNFRLTWLAYHKIRHCEPEHSVVTYFITYHVSRCATFYRMLHSVTPLIFFSM